MQIDKSHSLCCTDLGDRESLFHEFDTVLFEKVSAENIFGLLDASSLLWRLNTMDIDVGEERWKRLTDALATHVDNHRSPWLVSISSAVSIMILSLPLSLSLSLSPGLMLTS